MPQDCILCNGEGYWEADDKTELCPICKPQEREIYARQNVNMPERNMFWDFIPAKCSSPLFASLPWLIVVHSGESGEGVAEYFNNPTDGRVVSAHIAWSKKKKRFAQCVPLNRVAWHCGGSVFEGKKHLNFCSIGVELPGPWDKKRTALEKELFRNSLGLLLEIIPSLRVITTHRLIDARKRDPGLGFDRSWLAGFYKLDVRV